MPIEMNNHSITGPSGRRYDHTDFDAHILFYWVNVLSIIDTIEDVALTQNPSFQYKKTCIQDDLHSYRRDAIESYKKHILKNKDVTFANNSLILEDATMKVIRSVDSHVCYGIQYLLDLGSSPIKIYPSRGNIQQNMLSRTVLNSWHVALMTSYSTNPGVYEQILSGLLSIKIDLLDIILSRPMCTNLLGTAYTELLAEKVNDEWQKSIKEQQIAYTGVAVIYSLFDRSISMMFLWFMIRHEMLAALERNKNTAIMCVLALYKTMVWVPFKHRCIQYFSFLINRARIFLYEYPWQ